MARTGISYRGLGVDNSTVPQLVAEREQLQAQIDKNNRNNQELRRQRAQTEMENEVGFDYDYTEGKGTRLREEIDNKIMATKKQNVIDYFTGSSVNGHTYLGDVEETTKYAATSGNAQLFSRKPAQEISSIAKMNSEIDYAVSTGSSDPRPEMKKMVEKVNKTKMGGFGHKIKRAGAFGIGAIVVGGVLANMMGNGGQQSNAQLYGQQPLY